MVTLMERDGYQPDKSFMDDRDIPIPPNGGSEVGDTPELKCNPNFAPNKIYLQVHGDEDPEGLTIEELQDIPWDEVSWCSDQINEWDQEYMRADLYDDPLTDSTDWAHPAWWRAEEYSYIMMCQRINEYLDGEGYEGTSHEELEVIKHRIRVLRERPPAAFTIQCTLVLGVALGIAITYFYPF